MLHADDLIMNKITSKPFFLTPDKESVTWLRKLAKEYRKAAADKPNNLLEVLHDNVNVLYKSAKDFTYPKLVKDACKSAVSRVRDVRAFDGEYEMYDMFLSDAADHLEVAILLLNGASSRRIYDRLWDMATACRDEMAQSVWDYALREEKSTKKRG